MKASAGPVNIFLKWLCLMVCGKVLGASSLPTLDTICLFRLSKFTGVKLDTNWHLSDG